MEVADWAFLHTSGSDLSINIQKARLEELPRVEDTPTCFWLFGIIWSCQYKTCNATIKSMSWLFGKLKLELVMYISTGIE